MVFSGSVWSQLKNKTADDLIAALKKDGWQLERNCKGAIQVYYKDGSRVGIHYHPQKTFGAGLLKDLISDIGWEESDLKRLKLVK